MGRRKPKVREIDGCDDPLKPHARSPLDVRRQSTNGQAPEDKVAAGKIDAVTGEPWTNDLSEQPQNYLAVPDQPWLDGFCVGKGLIRQFVAMPLGEGYTAEEQLTGEARHGGLPWFDYYGGDLTALDGARKLAGLDSVAATKVKKGEGVQVGC